MTDEKKSIPAAEKKSIGISDAFQSITTQQAVLEKYADVTLRFIEEHGDTVGPLTPERDTKLRWKLYWHIMLLLSLTNLMLFVSDRLLDRSNCAIRYFI
jgi:hypothetical protein